MRPEQRPTHRHAASAMFAALMASALALGPALAHALELPAKIGMDPDAYFTVQRIYAGWAWLGLVLLAQLAALLAVIWTHRGRIAVMLWAGLALLGVLAAQAVFWTWTYPANQATRNWTERPDNWEALRTAWEYSHLAGAGFQLLAMAAVALAALARAAPYPSARGTQGIEATSIPSSRSASASSFEASP